MVDICYQNGSILSKLPQMEQMDGTYIKTQQLAWHPLQMYEFTHPLSTYNIPMMFVVNMASHMSICHVFYQNRRSVFGFCCFLALKKWQVSFEGIREFIGKSYDLSNFLAKYQAKPIGRGMDAKWKKRHRKRFLWVCFVRGKCLKRRPKKNPKTWGDRLTLHICNTFIMYIFVFK